MARIVEILIAVNCLAGIGAFFGARTMVRKVIRRRRPTPTEVVKR